MSGISIDINFSGAHKLFRIAESQNRGIDEVLTDAIKLYDFINSNLLSIYYKQFQFIKNNE